MVRRIIEIDQDKCNGCGACAAACHEGAIGMVDGKATRCGTTTVTVWAIAAHLSHWGHLFCGAGGRRI